MLISKINDLRKEILAWKKENKVIGFVPTMGALHAGHESLIKTAKETCDKVVVSIFVNPTQFGPNEDFDRYPRELEKDKNICLNNGVDIIFNPTVQEMYQDKNNLTMVYPPKSLKNKLCGKHRIGHFDGVATVVLKLFNIVQPDKVFFGQKDAQQLIIIKKMCQDLNLPVEIIGCPTLREPDELAMSSRNTYLSKDARQKALSLYKILKEIEKLYNSGVKSKKEVFQSVEKYLNDDIILEYLEVYDANTLEPVEVLKENSLVAIAANVGGVRLIDNIIIK